jgi:hypothetical protein
LIVVGMIEKAVAEAQSRITLSPASMSLDGSGGGGITYDCLIVALCV